MPPLPAEVVCQLHGEFVQGSDWTDVRLMHESDEVELAISPALAWKALLVNVEELHPPIHTESVPLASTSWPLTWLVCAQLRMEEVQVEDKVQEHLFHRYELAPALKVHSHHLMKELEFQNRLLRGTA